jgi:D-sedoheptulose 7-phosphate isomerase
MKNDIRNQLLQSIDIKTRALEFCVDSVEQAARLLIEVLRAGRTVYLCGNGGSAADCQHVAGELVGRFQLNRAALAALALTTDTSILTCVANDFDFEEIFARQLQAFGREGDCLIALSTSGNAVNVLKAAAVARQRKIKVIAFTGETGGQLKELADCLVAVPSEQTPRIQEVHITLLHIICGLVEKALFQP